MKLVLKSIMIGTGVAMDAFAVAMTNGLNYKKINCYNVLIIALMFGLFQGIMPLIGYFIGTFALKLFYKYMNVISVAILCLLGIKTIYQSVKNRYCSYNPKNVNLSFFVIFAQAIATSIDALTVGITLTYLSLIEVLICIFIIMLITFVLSLFGIFIGKKIGICLKTYAEIFGGLILIVIAITNLF